MNHFTNGFMDELQKVAQSPAHWAVKALPAIQKTMAPALATGTLGAIIGSKASQDPGTGAAKGALIGALGGMMPSAIHHYLKRKHPGMDFLSGIPATLTGAGTGAAIGGLAAEEDAGLGAALGALAGGAAAGIPTYLGLAKSL